MMGARAVKEVQTGKKPGGRKPKAPDAAADAEDLVNLTG